MIDTQYQNMFRMAVQNYVQAIYAVPYFSSSEFSGQKQLDRVEARLSSPTPEFAGCPFIVEVRTILGAN